MTNRLPAGLNRAKRKDRAAAETAQARRSDIAPMIGRRFGRLVVRALAPIDETGDYNSRWICDCDCGGKKTARGSRLRNGETQSCGCLAREASKRNIRLAAGITKPPVPPRLPAMTPEQYLHYKKLRWTVDGFRYDRASALGHCVESEVRMTFEEFAEATRVGSVIVLAKAHFTVYKLEYEFDGVLKSRSVFLRPLFETGKEYPDMDGLEFRLPGNLWDACKIAPVKKSSRRCSA